MIEPPSSESAGFADIEHWVFDLDNTLYSAECRLFHQIDRRMGEYIAALFDMSFDAARRLQKDYFRTHGTTLRGLMTNHGIDPADYLDYVHDIDLTAIDPSPALDRAISRLPGRKVIFTNADRKHAEQVIGRLGIARHFDGIFDIFDADFVPKPDPGIYGAFVERHKVRPERAVLFEDTAANLAPAAALGMTTVLVRPGEDGVVNDPGAPHIHHVTDDLAAWLTDAVSALNGKD
ncbi:MAG: pyrimidine 5'-nucleotidase [Alphaproteobacteria bacterium]|nr:pyrimidine 5'-nucleotidase [Alphaproteobacteria bacterium]